MLFLPGSRRFGKLWDAVRQQKLAPPADLRYLRRPLDRIGGEAQVRSDVLSFLEYIYNSVAETLPDFRDELSTASASVALNLADPYAKALHEECADPDLPTPKSKQRKKKGQVEINLSRTAKTFEERWLPPGSMKEYYEQYVLQSGLEKPGSFPTFWRVTCHPEVDRTFPKTGLHAPH